MIEKTEQLPQNLIDFVMQLKNKRGTLIMILHRVQKMYGYIPRWVAKELSRMLDVPLAKIYGVATFYNFFKLEKVGKHIIQVCMGTACYLNGGQDILEEFSKILNIKEGQRTEDDLFSLESVRCLGCCSIAPVVKIDDKIYGNVTKSQIPEILSYYTEKAKGE